MSEASELGRLQRLQSFYGRWGEAGDRYRQVLEAAVKALAEGDGCDGDSDFNNFP